MTDQNLFIQDYWIFGLCPLSGILKDIKKTVFQKLDLLPSSVSEM
jgi:hypothetical protein